MHVTCIFLARQARISEFLKNDMYFPGKSSRFSGFLEKSHVFSGKSGKFSGFLKNDMYLLQHPEIWPPKIHVILFHFVELRRSRNIVFPDLVFARENVRVRTVQHGTVLYGFIQ